MAKEYIGSQEHFEDEINAYYEQKEEMEREMQKQYEKEMMDQMERDRCTISHYITKYSDEKQFNPTFRELAERVEKKMKG